MSITLREELNGCNILYDDNAEPNEFGGYGNRFLVTCPAHDEGNGFAYLSEARDAANEGTRVVCEVCQYQAERVRDIYRTQMERILDIIGNLSDYSN